MESNSFHPVATHSSRFTGPWSLSIRIGSIAILALKILIITWVDAARAATIRDGDDFSISIEPPGARVCIIFPQSARDPVACADLNLPQQPPNIPGSRYLAKGLIRFVDRGVAATAEFDVSFIPRFGLTVQDNAEAEAFARGVEEAIAHEHPGSKVREGTSHVEMRPIAGTKVARVVFDVDGLNRADRLRGEHYIWYFAWTTKEGGLYSFVLSEAGEHAAAVDAMADASALTLKVRNPAQPSPLSPERSPGFRLGVGLGLWFWFAVATLIHLLWAYVRPETGFTKPTSLASLPAGAPFLNAEELDVSTPARLRKPIRSAARALVIVGLFSGIHVSGYLDHDFRFFVADLVCVVVVVWCASRISKGLRSGSLLCAGLACAWCVVWGGYEVFRDLPRAMKVNLNFHSIFFTVIGLSLYFVPLAFLVRGLLAFRSLRAYQHRARNTGDPLANHPWEEGLYIRKHPRFVNKRSVSAHVVILLAPLPYLLVWASAHVPEEDSVSFLVGYNAAGVCMALAMVVWGTHIYRRARKEAMLPGSALVKKDSRPIVLYLRSFHDDSKIKLRARATDGRILLERLVKISFEELVTNHLWGYGPVLAIGNPRAKGKILLGAARDYLTDESWQQTAKDLMRQGSMIIAIAAATPGLAWEIETLVELGFMPKFALLLPPLESRELEARWQFLLGSAVGSRLPTQIDLSRARAVVFPDGHPIPIVGTKRNEWTYEAVLDEAALVIAYQVHITQSSFR
jgi:hypothetical protein